METPEDGERSSEEEDIDFLDETHDASTEVEEDDSSTCFEEDDVLAATAERFSDDEDGRVLMTKQHCSRGLETAIGIKSGQVKQWVVGQHVASVRSLGYFQKKEGITGYKIFISWKNPGK